MRQYYLIILASAFVLVFTSCKSEADVLITDFEKLVLDASKKHNSSDDAAWIQLSHEYKKLNNRYSQLESKLSEKDKEKINILKGRFYSKMVKHEAGRLKEKLMNEYNKAKGFVNEFLGDP